MLTAIWLVSSCQKETATNNQATITEQGAFTEKTADPTAASARTGTIETAVAATKTVSPLCSVCDPDTKAFNLLDQLKTSPLRDGSNIVRDLGNGLRAVAQVKKGQISQWVLQDKTGKTYLPQSTEKKAQQSYRPGAGWSNIWIICYFTPYGWYCIWVVWGY